MRASLYPLAIATLCGVCQSLLAFPILAASITMGKTYAILEPDALAEIEARVERSSWNGKELFGDPSTWSATKSATLKLAVNNRIRHVVPEYALTIDIPDTRKGREGKLLYPKGYTFNPLQYVKMTGRLIIVPPHLIAWGRGQMRLGDMLLLSGGNIVAEINKYQDAIFVLEPRIKERFQLTHAPVIVEQDGNRLRLHEIAITDIKAVAAPELSNRTSGIEKRKP